MDFKYKIADVAKEFGMPAKKVVETVSGVTGEAYKTAGTFEEKELNVLLETLTRENAEDSLDAYLASGKEPAPAPKAEKKPEPKKQLAAAQKPAAEPKPAEQPKPAAKKEPKPEQKKDSRKPEKQAEKRSEKRVTLQELAADTGIKEPVKTEQVQVNRAQVSVDTRTVDVNVDKFNARYDDLADSRNMPSKRKNQPPGKKDKFNNRNNRRGKGAVVEARLDKGQGPIATLLVQNGTLHKGDCLIAGTAVGRVRTMRNDKGQEITEAGPSTPVEITGLTEVPEAGELFEAVEDERLARELADKRTAEAKEKQFAAYTKVTLDNLFDQMAANDMKELPIIVKADVQGSAEAVKQSLEKISNDEVRVRVIHAGVGAISKSDVSLADASNAIIIGFNVRPDAVAKAEAEQTGVEMRMYRVIYDAINDVSDAMKGMLAPKVREVALGEAQVRQVYKISSVGTVAGCRVTDGKITRDAQLRLVRDGIVICEDSIASLKRFKDDAKEVAAGFECGITLAKFQDIKEGDVFECFKMEEYRD